MNIIEWFKSKWKVIVSIIVLIIIGLFVPPLFNDSFTTQASTPDTNPNLVVYLSWDNASDYGQNDGVVDDFVSRGSASGVTNNDVCKWYGCTNLTATSGDYWNSSNAFVLGDKMTVSFWVYPTQAATGASSQAYYMMGETDTLNMKYAQEGDYGLAPEWEANTGTVQHSSGSSQESAVNTWTHWVSIYDGSIGRLVTYKDGVVVANTTENYGTLNYTSGEQIQVGRAIYGIDVIGYMDEFKIYNTSLSDAEAKALYNDFSAGTPPDLDLYVDSIKYVLPRNWSDENNSLIQGTMNINFTIANEGLNDSNNFTYKFSVSNVEVCSGNINIMSKSSSLVQCTWTTTYGYHKGLLELDINDDVNEDVESNNNQTVWIPFLDRPFYHFNMSQWDNTLKPYCINNTNKVADISCDFYKTFLSEDFNNGWTPDNIDPRGKKGRENAISCLYNNYNASYEACIRARNHLFGWGNRTGWDSVSNQAVHELIQLGITYDIMFKTLNETDVKTLSKQYHDIIQTVSTKSGIVIQGDTDTIEGGNGKGFGSGIGAFADLIAGEYSDNPTMILNYSQSYSEPSMLDTWHIRLKNYLKAGKNDGESKYQEGWLYKWYSQYHVVEVLRAMQLNNITTFVDDYQNYICGMGKEVITDILDSTYNGNSLRNDENYNYRSVQRGDSNSYERIGSGGLAQWDVVTYYGVLCDDEAVKNGTLYLRDKVYDDNNQTFSLQGMYIYYELKNGRTTPSNIYDFQKFFFDNNNDIVTLRTNYSYVNDNIIQVDGGEEKGSGHSQAQGWYGYFFGEPFFDYEQVPYNDNTRAENFKNTVTFTMDISGSHYSATCGNAELNQYYGMSDCPQLGTYPDYRSMPLSLTGDLEDYNAKTDASYMAVKKWMPYATNNGTVTEDFVVWGDMMVRSIIAESSSTGNIFDNHLYVLEEFNVTKSGSNYTIQREGAEKYVDVSLIYSNVTTGLVSENSTVQYGFDKTGVPTGNGYYGRVFLNVSASDVRFIRGYNWYNSTASVMAQIGSADKGVSQGNHNIVFDTDADNNVNISTHGTDGWVLGYDTTAKEYFANNATVLKISGSDLWTSNKSTAIFTTINSSQYTLYVNTMERANYIDTSRDVSVTFNVSQLDNTSGSYVSKGGVNVSSSLSGDLLSFTVSSDQNGDTYIIYGANGGGSSCVPSDYASNLTKATCDLTSCVFVGSSCVDDRVRYATISICDFVSCV